MGALMARFQLGKVAALCVALLALTFCYLPLAVYADVSAALPTMQHTPVPIGDYIADVLAWARDSMVALAFAMVSMYAPAFVKEYLTAKVIARAVDYGIGVVEGATHGEVFDLRTSNAVLAAAERYILQHSRFVGKWLDDALKPRLIAALSKLGSLPPSSSVTTLDHTTLAERIASVKS
jgi:hypothetical protein